MRRARWSSSSTICFDRWRGILSGSWTRPGITGFSRLTSGDGGKREPQVTIFGRAIFHGPRSGGGSTVRQPDRARLIGRSESTQPFQHPRSLIMPATKKSKYSHLKLLGSAAVRFPTAPSVTTLETFENRYPNREYWILFDCPEFTSMCPVRWRPDFRKSRSTMFRASSASRANRSSSIWPPSATRGVSTRKS